jgi:hypothetical protein
VLRIRTASATAVMAATGAMPGRIVDAEVSRAARVPRAAADAVVREAHPPVASPA